jgi:arginine-tRNA-protein transferase
MACAECVSIRIPLASFQPTDSQLRAHRRCKRFRMQVGPPEADPQRLALYHAWHGMRRDTRGWHDSELDLEGYFYQLAFPHPSAREVTLWDGDRLVAVSLCDVTPNCWSAVYFFYDPEIARLSPGVANIMNCVDLARDHRAPHVYLGYRVMECASLRYKCAYRPHELLLGRPAMDEAPRWLPEEQYPRPAPLSSAP